jgi:hypothetical protein
MRAALASGGMPVGGWAAGLVSRRTRRQEGRYSSQKASKYSMWKAGPDVLEARQGGKWTDGQAGDRQACT